MRCVFELCGPCLSCVSALLVIGGCAGETGSSPIDASSVDTPSVDITLDARPQGPDGALDATADRAPPDAPAADAPDKFGDVAEAVDDATAPEGAFVGTVSFSQMPGLTPGGAISTVLASFARRAAPTAEPTCGVTEMGACTVRRCMITYADAGAAPSVSLVGAGVVEVDGIRGGRVALSRVPTIGSYLATRVEPIFSGGETLRVRAAGEPGGMPSFAAAITAPTPIALTAPTMPAGGLLLPVPLAQAMQLRWTGGGTEPVDVTVLGSSVPAIPPSTADRTQVTVECHFPAAPGAATIPLEVMALLRGSVSGTVTVGTYRTQQYRVAPHVVTVFAGATVAQWTAAFQ